MVKPVELECGRHLHGIAVGEVIEVRHRECAKRQGVDEVIHQRRMAAEGAVLGRLGREMTRGPDCRPPRDARVDWLTIAPQRPSGPPHWE